MVRAVAKPHHKERLSFNRPAIEINRFFSASIEIERGLNVHEMFDGSSASYSRVWTAHK
jgi:hypothetical protein